jgi:polyisoprenyl-phosphate glycosyltransferase
VSKETRRPVAVIIPAFNEEHRIATVLRAVSMARLVDEVVVVSDGSDDRTVQVAERFPRVRVIDLSANLGKGGAMAVGVAATKAPVVAFVDADLDGLRPEHVDKIIRPILDGACDMCIGVFRGGTFWSDAAQKISPYISGQRAMRRELFEAVPYIGDLRMGVEVAINNAAKRRKARVMRVVLPGVSNCLKEQKMGLMKGTAARARMYVEIGQAMVKTRKRPKSPRRIWR